MEGVWVLDFDEMDRKPSDTRDTASWSHENVLSSLFTSDFFGGVKARPNMMILLPNATQYCDNQDLIGSDNGNWDKGQAVCYERH